MGRQGSPLPPEIKRVVVDLKHYFDRSKTDKKELEQPSVTKVAHALDMGVATVKRIMADFNRNPDFFATYTSARASTANHF
jgi:hypothetical protein